MAHACLSFEPDGRDSYRCTVSTARGSLLHLSGGLADSNPSISGDGALSANLALVANAGAYAKHEFLFRRLRAAEKRASHRKQADRHANVACAIADMIDRLGASRRNRWCSACFAKTYHRRVDRTMSRPSAYLCEACGSPTTPSAAPQCKNMANRGTAVAGLPRYCAEHRHDIPGFNKVGQRLDTIDDYEAWLDYDKANLAKATKIIGGTALAAAVVAPAAFLAAPAIGGAIGSSLIGGSLTGAAATSHGLAMLGGGSLAAGGLGMAGGTVVVTAVGAGLGSALGAATTSSYVRTDKSFGIEKLRDGDGPSVILASGFLTEADNGWGQWQRMIDQRYPNAAVYRLHWGSKELRAIGTLALAGAGKAAAARIVAAMAGRASVRAAAKVPYVSALFIAKEAIANPWTVARTRSEMTGAVLADLIARSSGEHFVLVGHSLGARVMLSAAQLLGTSQEAPRIEAVHLLGAAVSSGGDWRTLNDSVRSGVWNYRSTNDAVLKYLYRGAQMGSSALGVAGFGSRFPNLHDRNVSRVVPYHSGYFDSVTLAKP